MDFNLLLTERLFRVEELNYGPPNRKDIAELIFLFNDIITQEISLICSTFLKTKKKSISASKICSRKKLYCINLQFVAISKIYIG